MPIISAYGLEDQTFLGTQIIGGVCSGSNSLAASSFTVTGFTSSYCHHKVASLTFAMTGTFTNSVTVTSIAYTMTDYGIVFYNGALPIQPKTYSKDNLLHSIFLCRFQFYLINLHMVIMKSM